MESILCMMTEDADPEDGVVATMVPGPDEVHVADEEGREELEVVTAHRSCNDKMPPSSFSPKLSLQGH